MNEHDSERISGILESSGMKRPQEVADADVIAVSYTHLRAHET